MARPIPMPDDISAGYEYPAADGSNYGFRVTQRVGDTCTGVNIYWGSGRCAGAEHALQAFKLSYRYIVGQRRPSTQPE